MEIRQNLEGNATQIMIFLPLYVGGLYLHYMCAHYMWAENNNDEAEHKNEVHLNNDIFESYRLYSHYMCAHYMWAENNNDEAEHKNEVHLNNNIFESYRRLG